MKKLIISLFALFFVSAIGAEVQKTSEQFVVAKGLAVQSFATQGQLSNPSSIDVDDRGRVWVAEAFNYRKKTRKAGDRILILEDSNGNGRADKTTVFYQNPDIDGVHGVCVLGNKAIVSAPDRILLLTDTDGDDKADAKKVLFTGKVLNPVNGQHDHAIHAVMFGPDGRLYFNFGNYNAGLWRADGSLVRDVFGNPVDNSRQPYQEGMVIRCELDGSRVEVLGYNFRNNWEVTVDSFGTMWQSDNDNGSSSCRVNFVMEYGNYGYRDERTGADYHSKRTNMEATMQRRMWHQNDPGVVPNLLITGSGAPTGILVYEGDLLPEPFRGQMIHAEPGRNVVLAFPAKQIGAGYSASIVDIVRSSVGRNYRPSDVSVAPDGSLFIADWFDPVDCCHRTINDAGRIFRVAPPKHAYAVSVYDFKTPAGAAKALQSPNLSARYKAWTALIGMQERARSALETMAGDDNPRFRARALWALAAIKDGASRAIEMALGDDSENIRALALRIARRHQLPVEPVVRQLVRDKSTLVRRECAVSLHRLTSAGSVQLWTELAAQYDGKDRWYLEALGIGEKGKETACLNAWLKKARDTWKTAAGRDIIWRSRAPEAAALLAKLLLSSSVPAAEHPRLLRALDFHDTKPKEAALTALLEGDAKRNPATYLEAFQRANPKFLEKHPEVLKRVESAMLASKGTVTFVDMVARFNRKDMVKHLMDMVQAAPETESGIRAAQQIFAFKEGHRIAAALNKPNQAPALLKALGFVGNNQAVAMLRTVTTDEARLEASRLLAITALGRSSSGAGVLMQLVQQKKLPAKFMPPAIQSLAASPGPNTRSFAAQHLDLLAPAGKRWPIELLLAAKPDAFRGKAVFQKAGCIACHIVQGEGFNFGPELSDIGNKLSSEQLFEAILKPNQNISLGYEGVNVSLKDGTQLIGFVTSESKTVLSLRIPGGRRKDILKADIKTRSAMKDSLMPTGLEAVISPQELVDLVGWLSSQLPELLAASIHGSPDVDIAVPNGTYTLQLLLYEGWRSRAADILIEGKTVGEKYDMFKEQGENFNHGSVLRHTFTLTDGNIDIEIKAHKVQDIHLGGLILSKGKGGGTVSTAILKSKSNLDLKNVLKAINFGDTRNLSIGNVKFTAAAVNTTVDGVTNKSAGDVYAGEHNQNLPLMQKEQKK
jgi:putative membrane-bound dehydrogenase-like protein